jgi:hypothetical protein
MRTSLDDVPPVLTKWTVSVEPDTLKVTLAPRVAFWKKKVWAALAGVAIAKPAARQRLAVSNRRTFTPSCPMEPLASSAHKWPAGRSRNLGKPEQTKRHYRNFIKLLKLQRII